MVRFTISMVGVVAYMLISVAAQGQDPTCDIESLLEPGDANKDLRFDSEDLVFVMAADRFNRGTPATWEEGDWNGDNQFDDEDLVSALATGNYEQGEYAIVAGGPAPTTRGGAPAVWRMDPGVPARMLFFGGMDPITDDTYTFDPIFGWLDLTNNSAPSPRCHHTLVDDGRGNTLLFGGFSRERRYNDTYRFDPATSQWILLNVTGDVPAPRCLQSAAIIPTRNEMLVHGGIQRGGGFGEDYFLDTSVLNLDTGRWRTIDDDAPPGGRSGAVTVYSAQEDAVFLWGGFRVRGTLRDLPNIFNEYRTELWRFDPQDDRWQEVAITGEVPVGREDPTYFWDDTFGRLYLFHGRNKLLPIADRMLDDAYVLHVAERRWERIQLSGDRPPTRWRATATLDPVTGEGWLFGGWSDNGQRNDTWRFNVNNHRWTKVCVPE